MSALLGFLFAPGFFQNAQVLGALALGGAVAAISGAVGVFVVIRAQSFAGHAIADFGGAGAAAAFLMGVNTLWGFLGFGVLSAVGVELLAKRARERDLSTGIVLSFALGIESLFLFLDTHFTGQGGAPMMILFGSVFIIKPSTVPAVVALTGATAAVLCAVARPLLLSSVDAELARTRGVPVRAVGVIFAVIMACVVEEASLIAGSLLGTALLIGPAAAAMRLTKRLGAAVAAAALFGVGAMWLGILLAYDSYLWPPSGRGWPVSFFVCVLTLAAYLLSRLKGEKRRREAAVGAPESAALKTESQKGEAV